MYNQVIIAAIVTSSTARVRIDTLWLSDTPQHKCILYVPTFSAVAQAATTMVLVTDAFVIDYAVSPYVL
jgi:hypothetical protein